MKHFLSVQTVSAFDMCDRSDFASTIAVSMAARNASKQDKDI